MMNFYNLHNDKLDNDDLYRKPLQYALLNVYDPEGLKIIEHIVKQDIGLIYWLAMTPYRDSGQDILKQMYLEVAQDKQRGWLVSYARDVIKGAWKEAEHLIADCPVSANLYAIDVLRDRFKEGEPVIMKHPGCACEYSERVIKGRWVEAEQYIMDDEPFYKYYRKIHRIRD